MERGEDEEPVKGNLPSGSAAADRADRTSRQANSSDPKEALHGHSMLV
jgi:hypothetical protein